MTNPTGHNRIGNVSNENQPSPPPTPPTLAESILQRVAAFVKSIFQPAGEASSSTGLAGRVVIPLSQPQSSEAANAAAQVVTTESLARGLKNWIDTGGKMSNRTNRQIAADRILAAYQNKATTLDLSELQLTSLPAEIGNLASLQRLYLQNNQLTSIPATIGSLANLQLLYLRQNKLTSLPAEIGNLASLQELNLKNNQLTSLPTEIGRLANLQQLYLHENQLTSLPAEIGSLAGLKKLYLHENQLTSLPAEIGNLANLRKLTIHLNSNLQSLPMTLGNCQGITELDIVGTAIRYAEKDAILARTRAMRDASGLLTLPNRLATWKAYGKAHVDLTFLGEEKPLSDRERIDIGEWLIRLERCQDFKYKREELARLVCNMLATLKDSVDFREAFFGKVAGNLECCDDRASMLLNTLYTDWRLSTLDSKTPDKEKIELLVKLAKTLTLRETLQSMITEYETKTKTPLDEDVEIFLYHEITNKDSMGLLTAIDNMHYTPIGEAPSVVDKRILRKAVEEKYLDTLLNQEALEKILLNYPTYQEGKEKIVTKAAAKASVVEEKDWTDNLRQYEAALRGIETEKENALKELKKEHVRQILAR